MQRLVFISFFSVIFALDCGATLGLPTGDPDHGLRRRYVQLNDTGVQEHSHFSQVRSTMPLGNAAEFDSSESDQSEEEAETHQDVYVKYCRDTVVHCYLDTLKSLLEFSDQVESSGRYAYFQSIAATNLQLPPEVCNSIYIKWQAQRRLQKEQD